jgi:hypothetical protein
VLADSSLNLVGFIGMVFMIWLSLYGSVLMLLNPQSKGGTTKSDLFGNTWVVGQGIHQEFFKKKKYDLRLSLITSRRSQKFDLYYLKRLS